MLQRIGEEVIERLRQAVRITEQRSARRAVVNHDRPPECPGRGPCPGRGCLKQHARPQWPQAQRKAPVVRPGEHQDVVREPGDPADFLSHRPERCPELASIPVSEQREVHLRPQRGQRGPQLVACVTQQPPLVCRRPAVAAGHVATGTIERLDSSGRHRLLRMCESLAGLTEPCLKPLSGAMILFQNMINQETERSGRLRDREDLFPGEDNPSYRYTKSSQ
jgi:hypothetical protein